MYVCVLNYNIYFIKTNWIWKLATHFCTCHFPINLVKYNQLQDMPLICFVMYLNIFQLYQDPFEYMEMLLSKSHHQQGCKVIYKWFSKDYNFVGQMWISKDNSLDFTQDQDYLSLAYIPFTKLPICSSFAILGVMRYAYNVKPLGVLYGSSNSAPFILTKWQLPTSSRFTIPWRVFSKPLLSSMLSDLKPYQQGTIIYSMTPTSNLFCSLSQNSSLKSHKQWYLSVKPTRVPAWWETIVYGYMDIIFTSNTLYGCIQKNTPNYICVCYYEIEPPFNISLGIDRSTMFLILTYQHKTNSY